MKLKTQSICILMLIILFIVQCDFIRKEKVKEYFKGSKILFAEGYTLKGKKVGVWKFYFMNSQLQAEKHYKEGKIIEIISCFDGEGNRMNSGTLQNGNGNVLLYHSNGTIAEEGDYKLGNKNGVWSYYHDNGKISIIGNYINGNKNGEWKSYDYDNNNIIELYNYENDLKKGKGVRLFSTYDNTPDILGGMCKQKKEDVYPEYPEGTILNSDTLSTENVRNWLNTTDTSYTFGQGNDIIHDWTPNNFNIISEEDFLSFGETNDKSIKLDSSSILFTDSVFTIQTAKARITYYFVKTQESGVIRTNFNGFVDPFKLYLITHWEEHSILTGNMHMIDSISNIDYSVISVSDGATEIPKISNNDKFLMVYSYNYHYSNISILERIEKIRKKGHLKELISFSVNGLVRDLRWTENNKICFKLDNQNYFDENLSKIGHYISRFPVDELKWNENNR